MASRYLTSRVEIFPGFWVAWVGQDRAMAERARSGFGGALIKCKNRVLCDHIGHEIRELRSRVGACGGLKLDPFEVGACAKRRADVALGGRRTAIEGVLDWCASSITGQVGGHISGASGHAGVTRYGRYPKMQPAAAAQLAPIEVFVKMLEQPHIGERIERCAAGEHQSLTLGGADKMSDHMEERILEHHLRCRCLVEALLRILLVTNVFDAKDRSGFHISFCAIGSPRTPMSASV